MRTRRGLLAIAMALILCVVACGGSDSGLEVNVARIGAPTGPNAALYFTVENGTDGADTLDGASTDVAPSIEIHETIENDDGTMGMQPLETPLEVEAGGTLVFEPGGLHLMLIDVDRLDVGDTVSVTLQWQNAGEMVVEAEVVEPQDAVEHEDHG